RTTRRTSSLHEPGPPPPAPPAPSTARARTCFRRLLFFFQAEDGIRDRNVTGVQTCALPISDCVTQMLRSLGARNRVEAALLAYRSEERRVGKECRSRWWGEHEKKNNVRTEDVCRASTRPDTY